jgi:hypothetical protein
MNIPIILSRKYVGSEWILDGDDYAGLTWLSETTKPTEKQLTDLWETVKLEIAAEEQSKADAKASAISKLEALGLNVNEVEAAFGLKK